MTQKTSPFLEGKWGWDFGESGWNTGADENWLKFSYMFDANVDAIVSTLPAAVNGEAYFLTTDNRIYFAVDGTFYSTPVPKWFEFKIKSTGIVYRFTGITTEVVPDASGLETRVSDLESEIVLKVDSAALSSSLGSQEVGYLARTQYDKNSDIVSVRDYDGNAGKPGATDDIIAIRTAVADGGAYLPDGIYPVGGFVNVNTDIKVHLEGNGRGSVISKNSSSSPAIVASRDSSNTKIEGLNLSLSAGGSATLGNPISMIDCNNGEIVDVVIEGMTGTGSGALLYPADEADQVNFHRVKDSRFHGDRSLSPNTNGFLITGNRACWMQGLYAKGAGAYAVEYKNKGTYSFMSDSFAEDSITAFGYGQTTVDDTGVSYCIAHNNISYNNSTAFAIGKGKNNLSSNFLVHIDSETPFVLRAGIRSDGTAANNSYPNWLFTGEVNEPVRFGASSNFVSAAFYNTPTSVAIFTAGAARNIVEVQHPGARDTIFSSISDTSGNPQSGTSGNVVFCPATGESRGSLSGRHRHQLASSGIGPSAASQKFVIESTGDTLFTVLTDGTGAGGIASVTPMGTAQLIHNPTSDYWQASGNTGGWFVRMSANLLRFGTDAAASIGSTINRMGDVFSVRFRPGAGAVLWTSGTGTPEGVVTAVVGSLYTRTDGGTNTTLYIKESGTGNTGWIAK